MKVKRFDPIRDAWERHPARVRKEVDAIADGPWVPATRPRHSTDRAFDGFLIGDRGLMFPPGTPVEEIPAVLPSNGQPPKRLAVMVNGVIVPRIGQLGEMHRLADERGYGVIGIRNATVGPGRDVLQACGDKLHIGTNDAVVATATLLQQQVDKREPILLIGSSHGALVLSRALKAQRRNECAAGWSEAAAAARAAVLDIVTQGGAAGRFPDGPNYLHVVNGLDWVPFLFGVALHWLPWVKPGKGATFSWFAERHRLGALSFRHGVVHGVARMFGKISHSPRKVYLGHDSTFASPVTAPREQAAMPGAPAWWRFAPI